MGKTWCHIDVLIECAQIVVLHKTGLSQNQILKQLGVMKSAVQKSTEKIDWKVFR